MNLLSININNLKTMRKQKLYSLAKKINPLIPYSKSTKRQLIDVIINNKTDINDVIPNSSCDINYTPEYIENLIEQIDYHRKESEKWRDLYIELLINNKTNINQISPNMIQLFNKIDNKSIIDCTQTTYRNKQTEKKEKPKGPWDFIKKKDNDKRSIGIRIKENSLIDHINNISRKEIEEMGFKSREEYFFNQLSLKKVKININSVKLKKRKNT